MAGHAELEHVANDLAHFAHLAFIGRRDADHPRHAVGQRALHGARRGGPALEWAVVEPIVAGAEAVERLPDQNRGGRPRTRFAKPSRDPGALANGISMERVLHEDGYSIRLRGTVVDVIMVNQLMDQLRRWLSKLPD